MLPTQAQPAKSSGRTLPGTEPFRILLPGTKFGAFDRNVNAAGLTNLIDNYNATQANQATPAGKVLIANGVMTLAQLQALGGVSPRLPTAADSQAGCNNSRQPGKFRMAPSHRLKAGVEAHVHGAIHH